MKHRIFIAVNLPESLKKKLSEYSRKWPELPARWTKKDNLHITLEFLGYVATEEIADIYKIVERVAASHSPFSVHLKGISYGPPEKMPPRMVWAEGEKSPELGALKDDLQNSLAEEKFRTDSGGRSFAPHVTLARIGAWNFRKIEPEERPEVQEEISFDFPVESIEIMESKLHRGGPEYFVLESCQLKN